jgi:outer membrane protein TolC
MIHGPFVRILSIFALSALRAAGPSWAQASSGPSPASTSAAQPPPAVISTQPAPGDYQGSVPQGTATTGTIQLSLDDAIERGLRANLGLLTTQQASAASRAQRLQALSTLLPTVTGTLSENVLQENLKTFGFNFPSTPGGPNIPTIVGPFGYSAVLANAKVPIVNISSWKNYRAAKERVTASELSIKDARDLVVQAVGNAYLSIIASAARVQATKVQVNTAQVLYRRASDQHDAGVAPGIDVLRSQVELKRQQQILVVVQNQMEKDKLTLARVIGMPVDQQFMVADPTPSVPLEAMSLDDALIKAYANRADYRAAEQQVHAAEESVRAAKAQWIPTLEASGFYGDEGPTFGNSHGVFTFQGSLNFNIFNGGRIKSEVQQQQVEATNRRNELANLKAQIDYQVRNALLDLKATNEQVSVARSNADLASQTLTQAQDRFSSGVADNLEVVQAQQSVADANETLITAQYQNNLSKVELARSLGLAEAGIRSYFARTPERH